MRDYIRPAVVLLIICSVISGALAVTYGITKDVIAVSEMTKANELRAEVLPMAESFEKVSGIDADVGTGTNVYPMIIEIYRGFLDGLDVGYAVSIVSKGYNGDISVMVGISEEKTISGVRIISHTETPGLGANSEKSGFYTQYDNKGVDPPLKVVKGIAPNESEISAISGATITSNAVTNAVNTAVAAVKELY